MINEKHMMRGAIAALMVGMTVLGVRQTRADGIPGTSPMTYSGTLEEGGVPVTGMRNVRLTVFDDATATDGVGNLPGIGLFTRRFLFQPEQEGRLRRLMLLFVALHHHPELALSGQKIMGG